MIITDYSMPGMTGFDLLREIKKSKYHKDVPVIIMSSENVPSRINRCLEEGAEEFFLKPVQLSDVKKLKPHLLKGQYTLFCLWDRKHRLALFGGRDLPEKVKRVFGKAYLL
ncbi:hypothetical protein TIFTF001_052764 [Ficus carica]|uniref:Response regulatory domain-containing protein n=1 Tax=Ficus carica TaxID=3494 RepID=A0AA88JCS9_FICCA|nr:hypothetical protein TIFTF001_052762 [Ficus carica]GMN72033.1 hypothetical protein TIFTF001_052764 [Ficus carica]